MDWSRIAAGFQHDGALRDIYVLGTSVQDWAKVWDFLRATPEWLTFEVGGQAAHPPADIAEIFQLSITQGALASVRLGKQRLNCHFFQDDEVEFDLDPRDVDGPAEVARLAGFLKALGRTTLKEVLLTVENAPDEVIARYDPTSGALMWLVGS